MRISKCVTDKVLKKFAYITPNILKNLEAASVEAKR